MEKCIHRFVGTREDKKGTLERFYYHPTDPDSKVLNQYQCSRCLRIMRKGKRWYYYMRCSVRIVKDDSHAYLNPAEDCGRPAVAMINDPTSYIRRWTRSFSTGHYACNQCTNRLSQAGEIECLDVVGARWRRTPSEVIRDEYGQPVCDDRGYLTVKPNPPAEVLIHSQGGLTEEQKSDWLERRKKWKEKKEKEQM